MAQPDTEAGDPLVDDREAARRTFEDAFVRGYRDCLLVLCCWQCGAPRVNEVGRHFCSPGCRTSWCAAHDRAEWAELIVCSTCQGPLAYPDQSFCSALCEAERTAARAWR
jgi:hypothetical protein